MKRLRILLIPFGALAEIILMLVTLIVGIFSKRRAIKITNWAMSRLPNRDWYIHA